MLIKLYKKVNNEYVLNAIHNSDRHDDWYWRDSQWYIRKYKKLGYVYAVDDRPRNGTVNLYYKEDLYELTSDLYAKDTDLTTLADYELEDFDIYVCNHCGSYFDGYYNDYEDNNCNHYCGYDCRDRHCFYCDCCDTYYSRHDNQYTVTRDGNTVCDSCLEDNYVCCEDCCEWIYQDDAVYNDNDGCWYCEDCYEDDSIIGDYHRQKRQGFTKQYATNEDRCKKHLFQGIELECECCGDSYREDIASAIDDIVNKDTKLFDFEDDGSLNDGYESISQPCTLAWWYENEPMIKNMLSTMIEMGCKSHDTSTCGLHIHFNRDYIDNDDDTITRLVYLFEKYKSELQKFSRRKSYGYCYFLSDEHGDDAKTLKYCKDNKDDGDRYRVVNLQNYNTIEIRLFKGTLKLETLYSAIEFVSNIVEYAKDKDDGAVECGSFEDIINYKDTKYLKQYCLDKNLI